MNSKPITINEHGQITIPKRFRELLNSPSITLEQENDGSNIIRLIPVQDVGGSLSSYALDESIELRDERKKAKEEEILS